MEVIDKITESCDLVELIDFMEMRKNQYHLDDGSCFPIIKLMRESSYMLKIDGKMSDRCDKYLKEVGEETINEYIRSIVHKKELSLDIKEKVEGEDKKNIGVLYWTLKKHYNISKQSNIAEEGRAWLREHEINKLLA